MQNGCLESLASVLKWHSSDLATFIILIMSSINLSTGQTPKPIAPSISQLGAMNFIHLKSFICCVKYKHNTYAVFEMEMDYFQNIN